MKGRPFLSATGCHSGTHRRNFYGAAPGYGRHADIFSYRPARLRLPKAFWGNAVKFREGGKMCIRDREEAEQVVFEITGKHVDLSEAAKNVQTKVPVMEVLTGMFRRQYIKRTLVLLAIVVFTNPATFTVTNWTATLLKAHGFSLEDSLMATTIISVGVPAGLFFSSFVTDLGGRKIPIMCMLIILAVLGPIFGNMTGYWPVVLTGVVLTAVVMAMGFTVFSYTAESYPTRMRNTATGFHSSTGRLAVAAAQPLIPMAYAAYSFDGVFWIFSFLCFVPAVVIAIWGQRTGGKSLEEIA